MTEKERLNRTLAFQGTDRVPVMEIALWEQTVEEWREQGLPDKAASADLFTGSDYFGLEGYDLILFNLTFPEPPLEEGIESEDDRYIRYKDGMGRTRLALKEGTVRGMRQSMDCYIDFPVKSRRDFTELKKLYISKPMDRLPGNWGEELETLHRSDRPSTFLDRYFGSFGLYSMLRNWIGTENLSYLFYDDPELIRECLEFLTDFITGQWLAGALDQAGFDLYYIHEDMAGKSGPLVSPDMFRDLFLPHYKTLVNFLKKNGVKNVIVDTDGNFEALIPVFLDAGVEGFGPIERAAGLDPVELRKEYGKAFFMIGGIDKRVLKAGEGDIDRELYRVLPPLLEEGGFIPTVDHSVPPDVSLRNFEYYLSVKRKIIEGG